MELATTLKPNVIVMDIGMPRLNGLDATRQILRESPGTRILIFSGHSSDDYVQQLISAGAAGYLNKQTAGDHLITAVREVHAGNVYYSPTISKRLSDHYRETSLRQGRVSVLRGSGDRLTPREREVLQLVAEGYCNKQMAVELSISIKTIEKHRQHAMDKLNIHDTAGLTRYAIAQGIIESTPQLA